MPPKYFLQMNNPVLKSVVKKYNKGEDEGDALKYLNEDEKTMIQDVLKYVVKEIANMQQKMHE